MDDSRAPATWLRRHDESSRAFVAFCHFRDTPLESRSLTGTAAAIGKSLRLIAGWSARHAWQQRAAAYDNHLDQERTKRVIAGRAKMAESLASDAVESRKLAMQILRKHAASIEKRKRLVPLGQAARLLEVSAGLEIDVRGGGPIEDDVATIHVHITQQPRPRYADEQSDQLAQADIRDDEPES